MRSTADWHDSALLHAIAWMLLGLPVVYVLVASTSYVWSWLHEAVSWLALAAMPAPAALILALCYVLYFRLPRRAWQIHRSRGGPLGRVLQRVPPSDDTAVGGLAR